ncbi:MAG: hypothetical protein SGCHY_000760 [Lobulomycetales sp.]
MEKTVESEERLAQAYDRCMADAVLNTSKAFLVGIGLSAFLFRRKSWPIAAATGAGAGFSYANCLHEIEKK